VKESLAVGLTFLFALSLAPRLASADDPAFGRFDVPTIFYINKSDDRNRVDYGVRLDERCWPSSEEPIFPYWREFEPPPPVRTHSLGAFDGLAYGVSHQRVVRRNANGALLLMKPKHVNRWIWVTTSKEADGHCSATATTTISGLEGMQLLSVYVKLAGFLSVEYVNIIGRNPRTGENVSERLQPR
jgi:hypothetical protein